jgi:hypothetical protein
MSIHISSDSVKKNLERVAPPGERHFRLFRSALRSTSPVEKFMHLYNILLMFFDDKRQAQERLDNFIKKIPNTSAKPILRKPNPNETVYTRLRNEFAHSRPVRMSSRRKQKWLSVSVN